jgi:hypothetical protein
VEGGLHQQSINIPSEATYRADGPEILSKMQRNLWPFITQRQHAQVRFLLPTFSLTVSDHSVNPTRPRLLRMVFAASNGAQFIASVMLAENDQTTTTTKQ